MAKKIYYLLHICFASFILSCSDDDSTPSIDDCVTTMSADHGQPVPGQYIITFNIDNRSTDRRQQAARSLASHAIVAKDDDIIEGNDVYIVAQLPDSVLSSLRNDPRVKHIEPDRILSIQACFTVQEPRLVTWNVARTGYGDGTGKTAWILDTGVDLDHPDLNVDTQKSRSFVDGISSADDDNGHGTHIAGIIGAKNNSIGTLGVASGASIVALKILKDNGEGLLSVALKALAYVRANGKPGDVANISMGLENISETLENEIRAVAARGIYVVVAAGNDGTDASQFSPARTSGNNIFTISAVDSLQHFAGFSNYGSVIDFAAPGVRIPSTYIGGKYAIMSGTSMAAPHVSGLLLINSGQVNSNGYAIDDPDGNPDPIASK